MLLDVLFDTAKKENFSVFSLKVEDVHTQYEHEL